MSPVFFSSVISLGLSLSYLPSTIISAQPPSVCCFPFFLTIFPATLLSTLCDSFPFSFLLLPPSPSPFLVFPAQSLIVCMLLFLHDKLSTHAFSLLSILTCVLYSLVSLAFSLIPLRFLILSAQSLVVCMLLFLLVKLSTHACFFISVQSFPCSLFSYLPRLAFSHAPFPPRFFPLSHIPSVASSRQVSTHAPLSLFFPVLFSSLTFLASLISTILSAQSLSV